jgi:hypothetical protein
VFSVYDSMALVCQKSEAYARTLWSRLISAKSEYKEELEDLVHSAPFCSSVQNNRYDTPVMTIRGLQQLVQILGGKVAADFRVIVEGVFTRFQAGDLNMIEEIRANAASDAPSTRPTARRCRRSLWLQKRMLQVHPCIVNPWISSASCEPQQQRGHLDMVWN